MTDEQPKVVPKVEPKVEPKVVAPPEKYHCTNCRTDKNVTQVTKMPLDYKRNEDGTAETTPGRYSVFCAVCQQFLAIIDPAAKKELNRIINRK